MITGDFEAATLSQHLLAISLIYGIGWLIWCRWKTLRDFPSNLFIMEIMLDYFDPHTDFDKGPHTKREARLIYEPYIWYQKYFVSEEYIDQRFSSIPKECHYKILEKMEMFKPYLKGIKKNIKTSEEKAQAILYCRSELDILYEACQEKRVNYFLAKRGLKKINKYLDYIISI